MSIHLNDFLTILFQCELVGLLGRQFPTLRRKWNSLGNPETGQWISDWINVQRRVMFYRICCRGVLNAVSILAEG